MVLLVALCSFVTFALLIGIGEISGFWNFNKILFLRILTSIFYSHILFAGLAIALVAIDQLFGIDIPDRRYPELWIFFAGIFTTSFFLAGIPERLNDLDGITSYPKGLKFFTQYILIPIVFIYTVILYAYVLKILVLWDLPHGWVSTLILCYSGVGIASLLLLYPIRENSENVWIKNLSRWFYVILIPLVVMLFVAIGRRLSEFGFTEGRYLVLVIGIWLTGMIAYFIISKKKNIKIIPISFCLLSFLVSFGPWSIFSVSEKSQVTRLEKLLAKDSILFDGKVRGVKILIRSIF